MQKAKGNEKKNEEKQMMRRRKETGKIYEDDRRETGTIRPFILLLVCSFSQMFAFLITTVIICDAFPDILPAHA